MPDQVGPLAQESRLNPLERAGQDKTQQHEAKLKKACQDFESIFVDYMMKQMRKTITQNGILGKNQAEQLYTSMLDSEIAKNVSHSRGIGLATVIYQQMGGIMKSDEIK